MSFQNGTNEINSNLLTQKQEISEVFTSKQGEPISEMWGVCLLPGPLASWGAGQAATPSLQLPLTTGIPDLRPHLICVLAALVSTG